MKRREFVRALTRQGCHLKRHGAKHDLYVNPATGQTAPVPRHPEIRDTLARGIRKQLVWTNAGKLRARRAYAPLPDASARAATHHLVVKGFCRASVSDANPLFRRNAMSVIRRRRIRSDRATVSNIEPSLRAPGFREYNSTSPE